MSDPISEERLRNTRAWAAARPDMSGSTVIVGAIDELLARRASKPTASMGDVAAERRRQVTAEGWTPAHDDEHDVGGTLAQFEATQGDVRLSSRELSLAGTKVEEAVMWAVKHITR